MPEPELPPGLLDWEQTGARGASASCIANHLTKWGGEPDGAYPLDAGDFGRCQKLLEMVPTMREDLHKMAEVNAYWAALVARWAEIAASEDQDALIRSIVSPIEDRDPTHARMSDQASMRLGAKVSFKDDATAQGLKQAHEAARKKQGKPQMKPDPTFDQAADNTYRVTANELRQFVERIERLDVEKKDLAEQQKEVMAEAKTRGYDTKVMRKVIALRKRDADEIAEEEAVLEMYKEALGM